MSNHQFARDLEDANAERLLADQPDRIAFSRWTTGRGHVTFVATVLTAEGKAFERREFANPQHCDWWAESWGLPVVGGAWSESHEVVSLTGLGWLVATEGVVETR